MERVAFLTEPDDLRISCMLNPETVTIKRSAGVKERESIGGHISGYNQSDMPLLYTGGGVTYIEMELLFDITIRGSALISGDVRDYTAPFFEMAENKYGRFGSKGPKTVRMIWGKNWNIPGVITDIAERLDYFTKSGVPRRSWVTLRLRRTKDEFTISDLIEKLIRLINNSANLIDSLDITSPYQQSEILEVLENESNMTVLNDRLDAIADRYYNTPSLWRVLASFNGITDIAQNYGNKLLKIPPIEALTKLL